MGVKFVFPLVYWCALCRRVTRISVLNKKRLRHTRMRLSDNHHQELEYLQHKKLQISGPFSDRRLLNSPEVKKMT